MNRIPQAALLFCSVVLSEGIGAQESRTPKNPWLLESYRPVVAVQLCGNPGIVNFDGSMEECRTEFDRLFDKCTTEVPNVSLPAEFSDKQEQIEGLTILYQCVLAHYRGGVALEEFNRKHPVKSSSSVEPGY